MSQIVKFVQEVKRFDWVFYGKHDVAFLRAPPPTKAYINASTNFRVKGVFFKGMREFMKSVKGYFQA